MKHSDIEELARECGLIEPRDVWADLPADYTQALLRLSAGVLEKAAQVCDAEANNWDDDKGLIVCAKEIRRMPAALQSGDSSGGVK